MTPGIHLLHKPVGPSSFAFMSACIESVPDAHARKRPRICHGGTLDPFASGLLLILVQPATQLFDYLHAIPKVYHATVRWGTETDNCDPHGATIFSGDPSGLSLEKLDNALLAGLSARGELAESRFAARKPTAFGRARRILRSRLGARPGAAAGLRGASHRPSSNRDRAVGRSGTRRAR